jgi:hypothetical protein
MDQRLNPYTPRSGIKPLKLAGRDNDLEAFRVLLQRLTDGQSERSLIYSGLRGVGKTVLLLEFETLAREAGWVCNDVEEVGSGGLLKRGYPGENYFLCFFLVLPYFFSALSTQRARAFCDLSFLHCLSAFASN